MTDDQLLRAAEFILSVFGDHIGDKWRGNYVGSYKDSCDVIVAILREEMDKEPERPPLTETLRALYDICPEKFDDPTKSFVLTTEG